jgi:hypothetical protein
MISKEKENHRLKPVPPAESRETEVNNVIEPDPKGARSATAQPFAKPIRAV